MADPTLEELQTQIDELKDLITTQYEPPSSVESSFPVVDAPMNDEQWGALFKSFGSGVISFGQWPYRLFLDPDSDVTNQVRISPATDVATKDSVGVVEGFAHRLLEHKYLTIPAVQVRTRYLIALQYDPVRAQNTGEPVVLDVFAGTLDQSQGKKYVLLHEGYRDPSTVLSQMTWTGVRPRLAPTITVHRAVNLPNPQHSGLIWGTRCLCTDEGTEWMLTHHPTTEVMRWENISDPAWAALPLARYRGQASHGFAAGFQKKGNKVRLRGHITRVVDGREALFPSATELVMGTLPSFARPAQDHVVLTAISGQANPRSARITVEPSGRVVAYVGSECSWIALDGIEFDVE